MEHPLSEETTGHRVKFTMITRLLCMLTPLAGKSLANRFVNAVYKEDATGYETVICHNPQFTVGGKHSCRSSCAMNYPVQTCGSVCSVISMVMAAVATHKPDLLLEMISR